MCLATLSPLWTPSFSAVTASHQRGGRKLAASFYFAQNLLRKILHIERLLWGITKKYLYLFEDGRSKT